LREFLNRFLPEANLEKCSTDSGKFTLSLVPQPTAAINVV
jgi:hypothetical protein